MKIFSHFWTSFLHSGHRLVLLAHCMQQQTWWHGKKSASFGRSRQMAHSRVIEIDSDESSARCLASFTLAFFFFRRFFSLSFCLRTHTWAVS